MTHEKIKKTLEQNQGKEVWVTFIDEEPILLTVGNLDSEGFTNHVGDGQFWATYEGVIDVKA